MKSHQYGAVMLDLGKVLVDFDVREFGRRILSRVEMAPEALRDAIMGGNLARQYEIGAVGDEEFHQELCRRIRCDIPWVDFHEAWTSIFLPQPLVPEEVISALAAEAPLWIVSNTNKAHFDCIAGRFGFLRFFQGWILSHEVGAAKPDRRIFELALGRAGVAAHEALFVDDSLENVEAARAIGMDAFQFVGLPGFRQELAVRGLLCG
jgi:FMN phosphatase YigB (HAD superfamily)